MGKFVIAVNTGDTLSPFDNIQTASAELGRSLKLRWAAALHRKIANQADIADPIDERRQNAKEEL